MATLSDTLAGIQGDITDLQDEVKNIDENVLKRLKDLTMSVARIDETVQTMLGQKRQLDTLLGRWAREIQDVELKQDVMRYIFGDIACDEVLESDAVPSAPFESPERPLMRTPTCPPAPKRVRLESVAE